MVNRPVAYRDAIRPVHVEARPTLDDAGTPLPTKHEHPPPLIARPSGESIADRRDSSAASPASARAPGRSPGAGAHLRCAAAPRSSRVDRGRARPGCRERLRCRNSSAVASMRCIIASCSSAATDRLIRSSSACRTSRASCLDQKSHSFSQILQSVPTACSACWSVMPAVGRAQ